MNPEKACILYIDDEPENLSGFKYIYRKHYDIHLAKNAQGGIGILRNTPIKVLITDQRMPGITGIEFLEQTIKEFPDTIRIILTGYTDIEDIIQAINKGQVYRYITKPWDKDELKVTIDNAIKSYDLKIENKNLIRSLREANKQLEETNRNLEKKIKERTLEIQKKNEELEKHQYNLERLVLERTSDLKKAKEKAEESDKLKSAFLANLSHELRTPMNAIIGFSNLLDDQDTTMQQKKEFIQIINQNGNALLKLIDDIIDISQIEANQIDIHIRQFNLTSLLKELVIYYTKQKEILGKTNIELILQNPFENEDFFIFSDELRLRQILTNLIDNAFKFTKKGKIIVGFEMLKNKKADHDILTFYVKDTGIGIKKNDYEIIFSRFRKIQPDHDISLYSGSGLGLAISKSLVKLLGGNIWIHSEKGKGSEFYFTVPSKTLIHNDEVKLSATKTLLDDSPNWKNHNILIAEDEETNFKFIEAALKKTEIKLLRAITGKQVIELIDSNPQIDLILMDIRMPEMDGFEATKLIKKTNHSIPIIAQTAYARENEKQEVFKAGCDDYLAKPYKAEDLLQIINKFLT